MPAFSALRLAACAVPLVVLATPACTAFVVQDLLDAPSPCAAPGDCAAGSSCVDGNCAPAEPAAGAPPAGVPVSSAGASVEGPDGLTLVVPPEAVAETIHVEIRRASSTLVPEGFAPKSRWYRIDPAAVLVEPASLTLPLELPCAECALYLRSEDGTFVVLEESPASPGTVAGLLPVLGGVVVAGGPAEDGDDGEGGP